MVSIYILLLILIFIILYINYKKNLDNFLSKSMLLDRGEFNFCKINKIIENKLKKRKKKLIDIDEILMNHNLGETIYDVI